MTYPFNPFVAKAPFLYHLKTSENRKVFWYLQGIEKGCIGNEWFKIWEWWHKNHAIYQNSKWNSYDDKKKESAQSVQMNILILIEMSKPGYISTISQGLKGSSKNRTKHTACPFHIQLTLPSSPPAHTPTFWDFHYYLKQVIDFTEELKIPIHVSHISCFLYNTYSLLPGFNITDKGSTKFNIWSFQTKIENQSKLSKIISSALYRSDS